MTESSSQLQAVRPDEAEPSARLSGVTPPHGRGGSGRYLTDVLTDLGYVDSHRVQKAIEEARTAGRPPERVLLDSHAITGEQLSRAIAERYGLDHLDLAAFDIDMSAANLLSSAAARRYNVPR
jgi:type IV pilus assembly protein PilB